MRKIASIKFTELQLIRLEQAFWPKVEKSDGCWNWRAAIETYGYGALRFGQKTYKAHRIAWAISHNGECPGLMICHKCDNRLCVNPDHLFSGTHSDNMSDMVNKGRQSRGVLQAKTKLSPEMVREIRSTPNPSIGKLGRKYQVDPCAIYKVLKNKTWKHIT